MYKVEDCLKMKERRKLGRECKEENVRSRKRRLPPTNSLILFFFFFLFFFLATPHGMWDLSSLTRDQTCAPCSGSTES